ncbi:MAG TPA: hypothetical protein VH482_16675 [Thermomicrobiales bacterium]|jgi:quercetin dioxygenase-like cupin family protein
MDTHLSPHPAPARSDGVSRREVLLGIGVSGLGIALFARGIEAASAQDATPAANGLPPGVGLTPLITIPIRDMPTAPFSLSLTRLTLEPGASVPNSSVPFPEIAFTESGTLTCPGGDGRWVYAPDGTVTASGPGDHPVPAGSAIYTAPNALDGARNDGTEPVSALVIDLVPAEGAATPTA